MNVPKNQIGTLIEEIEIEAKEEEMILIPAC